MERLEGSPATPPLAVRLFGDFRLRLAEVDARPRGRKAAGVLAFLAAADDHSASRVRLADLLWSDRGEEQARSSLRQVILELRSSPAGRVGAIVATRESVRFVPGAIFTDEDAICTAAAHGNAAVLAPLLEPLIGRFLDDLDGLSPAFDDWLMSERPRREEKLFATVLAALPQIPEPASDGASERILRALERLDPLNEPVVRLRLGRDHAAGDVAAMHRRLRRLTDDLKRELGVAPSAITRELFDALLNRPPELSPGAGSSGPVASVRTLPVVLVTPFVASGITESNEVAAILTEDVRAGLARNGELRVLMIEATDEERVQTAAANAIAAYQLGGSVRTLGERTSVTVELGNIATGLVSWSAQIRLAASPLELIDEIVARIVGGVAPAVERDLSVALAVPRAGSEATREVALLYARGRRLAREGRTIAEVREGVELLEAALRQDPRHIGARLRLSALYNTDFAFLLAGHDVAGFRRRAQVLIEEAAALDPGNIRIELGLAWYHLRRGAWPAAERLFQHAVAAMPHDPDALDECAFGLACLGDLDLARSLMQRAFQLNPFAPAEYHADQAVLLTLAGDAEAAEEHFAVCGERRIFYHAFRLGNLQRLEIGSPRLGEFQRRFVAEFLEIWQPSTPPGQADLVNWVDQSICLRRPEHRRLIIDGVAAAWLSGARDKSL